MADGQKIETKRDEEAVILNQPPLCSKKTQGLQRIHHFMTWNNYKRENLSILKDVWEEFCYSYAFQEEMGESGTKHIQGVCSCKKRCRDSEFGLPKEIHWEKPAKLAQAYLYCTDPDKRYGLCYTKGYTRPYSFKLENFFWWQNHIMYDILAKAPDDRKVYWFWSKKGGVGKSTFVKHLAFNFNTLFITKGKFSDISNMVYKHNMREGTVVVFDLPRNQGNSISYDAIESIKNGLIANTKYETGWKGFPSPHILIFANEEPDYEKLWKDRWVVIDIDKQQINELPEQSRKITLAFS